MESEAPENTTDTSLSTTNPLSSELPPPKPKETILDAKLILDSIKLYNKLNNSCVITPQSETSSSQTDEELLLSTKIFMLNSKHISKITNLEIYQNLEDLYLSNNFITEITCLDHLTSLQVLNLKNNYISKIQNIKHLSNLQLLDISYNEITQFDINEIPSKSLIYIYLFDNPFFKNISLFQYRSDLITTCSHLERIDKLDIKDRERLILSDVSNLKSKFSLKSLNYINEHYESMKIVINKNTDTQTNTNNKSTSNNESTTVSKEDNNKLIENERQQLKEKMNALQKESDDFLSQSLLSMQRNSKEFRERSKDNKKRFLESDTVKEMRKQIDILREKFKKTAFADEKVKEAFKQKILNAINFQERMLNAEKYTQRAIDKITQRKGKEESDGNKTELNVIKEEKEKEEEIKTNTNNANNKKYDNPLLSDSDIEDLDLD